MQEAVALAHFEGTRLVFQSGAREYCCDATALISSLLVHTAKGDGSISAAETGEMINILTSQLGAANAEAMEHLSSAVMRLANDKDIAMELRRIGEGLSLEDKEAVFAMVLDIARVDEEVHQGEKQAILFAGQILGLSQDRVYSELRAIAKA